MGEWSLSKDSPQGVVWDSLVLHSHPKGTVGDQVLFSRVHGSTGDPIPTRDVVFGLGDGDLTFGSSHWMTRGRSLQSSSENV